MTRVEVDGIVYLPTLGTRRASVGIGITTRNRPEIAAETLRRIVALTPGARIVLVDDASTTAYPDDVFDEVEVFRFEQNVGIARAKNKCLELLQDCEHIFLFDDDAYPLVEDWYWPYIDSPEPHLMRIFLDLATANKLNDIKVIYSDNSHIAYTGPRGMMLYVERRVLDMVGGMDVAFGAWGYEHGDWSNRIHNAGLTTWRFADVVGSEKLVYSLDEYEKADRTVDRYKRRDLVAQNLPLYHRQWNSSDYREFRKTRRVVLTCLFTENPDPQRAIKMMPDIGLLKTLLDSMLEEEVVIFTDQIQEMELPASKPDWRIIQEVPGVTNPYLQRWISYWRYLRENPDIEEVWCVDGTDVQLLRSPWALERDRLYIGTEATTVDSGWLAKNSSTEMERFVGENGRKQLLNAGLVGGKRAVVMEFLHDLIHDYQNNLIEVFHKKAQDVVRGVNDMGLLNMVARSERWEHRLVHGPQINTVFKANATNGWSLWRHK